MAKLCRRRQQSWSRPVSSHRSSGSCLYRRSWSIIHDVPERFKPWSGFLGLVSRCWSGNGRQCRRSCFQSESSSRNSWRHQWSRKLTSRFTRHVQNFFAPLTERDDKGVGDAMLLMVLPSTVQRRTEDCAVHIEICFKSVGREVQTYT